MDNPLQIGEEGVNLIATPTTRPGSFPLGSLESRAAARVLAQTKARGLEFTPAIDAAVADPLTWLQQHTHTRDNHWRESGAKSPYRPFPDKPYFHINECEESQLSIVDWSAA